MRSLIVASAFLLLSGTAMAQLDKNPGSNHGNRFEQLDFLLQSLMNIVPPPVPLVPATGNRKQIMILR